MFWAGLISIFRIIDMRQLVLLSTIVSLVGCASAADEPIFESTEVTSFNEPWAMAFLPDGRMLVTEKSGQLIVTTETGDKTSVSGVPAVEYGGQGGLGDVALHPEFEQNSIIYLSFAEAGDDDTRGAAIARATLDLDAMTLSAVDVIWQQLPKVTGKGHYGHRLLFDDDGYLWVSSGDRQKFDPSQDMQSTMGKILRLNDDGTATEGNPFADRGGITAEIWSLGHRNPLGIDFDLNGELWNVEMGPRGGDELNRVIRGENYGYPTVSNGRHYSGRDIPDHDTRPEFEAPKAWWTPVISPGNLEIYSGDLFPDWKGHALIAGLSSQALILVHLTDDSAEEHARYDMGKRIRSVEQGPDGAVWLLEDQRGGRLLKLTPNN